MFVVAAADRIVPAQKATSHTAVDTMKDGDFLRIKQIRARQTSHSNLPQNGATGDSVQNSERLSSSKTNKTQTS